MCCRYWTAESPELREIVEEMNRSALVERWQQVAPIATSGEIFPASVVPVIASNRAGIRSVFPMKWGFTARTTLLNARVETAAVKPLFRDAWAAHRCIVPASWYFEWSHTTNTNGRRHTGEKYRIQPRDSAMTWLCGLYRMENGLPVFVILTREADEGIRFIHDRMPLILPKNCVDAWIDPHTNPGQVAEAALTDMVYEVVG